MYKSAQGFSLIEVMISVFVASIALLGLAAGQIKSLQYASNSFDYTLSLLQANNAIEQTWINLCDIEKNTVNFDDVSAGAQFNKYTLLYPNNYNREKFKVSVAWVENRIDDGLINRVEVEASFPDIKASC